MIIMPARGTSTLSMIPDTIKAFANITPNKAISVLDGGCGHGIYGHILKALFQDKVTVYGCDVKHSPFIDGVYKEFYNASIREVLLENDFDCVLLLHVLEHMMKDEALSLIKLAQEACDYIVVGLPASRKGHVYRQDVNDPDSHKWGVHDFPFKSVRLEKYSKKYNIYTWRYKDAE